MPTYKTLTCKKCKKVFKRLLSHFNIKTMTNEFCSNKCASLSKKKAKVVICKYCQTSFEKQLCEIKKSKSGNHFCSKSCAAKYNNAHKTTGTKVSKLELWLQKKLDSIYPNIEILYNDKTTINSELDIYIPSLQLAFELNGIFHYEPIFGKDKLMSIQENDNNKYALCLEHQIDLCIIDTTSQKRFTEKSSIKFLDIVKSIIEKRL
jgi:hypothetical protein